MAVALDSGGRARVACSIRREKESGDEVAVVSEITRTSSTVAIDEAWRFTSLSIVVDDYDRPHVASTGAHGRIFYATVAR